MNHEHFMKRCIQLAGMGLGNAAPNPLVGCVIVYDSKIIGEGYHEKYGSHHAEVNAINAVKDKNLLSESLLYVTLEPCNHFGKTPPCTDLIIKHKIPEVVIGNEDPFEKVSGSGIKKLRAAGVKVTTGVLEEGCRFMNRRFLAFHGKKRPYIILKWAQSHDGFIAPLINNSKDKIHWISNEYSRVLVHKWRSEEAAIMVGTNTALQDNPKLTVRGWTGKNPVRIVTDKNLRLSPALHLLDQKIKTIVFTSQVKESTKNLQYVNINFKKDSLKQMIRYLYEAEIQSVIIEGGAQLLTSFIENNLWDEARVFTSSKMLHDGINVPAFDGIMLSEQNISEDILRVYRR